MYLQIPTEGHRLPGYNCDIDAQKQILHKILSQNSILFEVLTEAQALGLDDYYIGAGCVCQTVWNFQNGLEPMHGISDIDFVYYDADLSYEAEDHVINRVNRAFCTLPVKIDVKNEARVHLWYKGHHGYDIAPYPSVESAINTWPTTATAIGVRLRDRALTVYAPFGLNDMFGQIVRPNKAQITEEIYLKKCKKWGAKWDTLTFIPW